MAYAQGESDVLVIGFRQARVFNKPIPYDELRVYGVLKGQPRALQAIGAEAAEWLATRP